MKTKRWKHIWNYSIIIYDENAMEIGNKDIQYNVSKKNHTTVTQRYYTITALERDQYGVLWSRVQQYWKRQSRVQYCCTLLHKTSYWSSSSVVIVLLHTALFYSNFEILWKLWNFWNFLKILSFWIFLKSYENFEFLKKIWNYKKF
jgi:hypothetical protein